MDTFDLPKHINDIYERCSTFIVIGAFDGESFDDFFTKVEEKKDKNKSKIIFVEPIKKYYNILVEKSKKLSNFEVFCENFAVSDKIENLKMVSVKENLLSKYGWYIEGCACVLEDGVPINIYMKKVEEQDLDIQNSESTTFYELLKKHNLTSCDFLQIDTEGYDERILESIDFEQTKINFLKFEKHYLSEGFIDKFIEKLRPLNYSRYWDNDNHYFVKNNLING